MEKVHYKLKEFRIPPVPLLTSVGFHVFIFLFLSFLLCPWLEKKTSTGTKRAAVDLQFVLDLEKGAANSGRKKPQTTYPVTEILPTQAKIIAPSLATTSVASDVSDVKVNEETVSFEAYAKATIQDYIQWVTEHNPSPQYPRLARIRGDQGRVVVHLTILRDGKLAQSPILEESSGSDLLDRLVLRTVEGWAFPVFQSSNTQIEFSVPFRFSLED